MPPHYLMPAEWIEQTGTEYLLQVAGECMTSAGINDGDIIGFRKQPSANDGDIVVAHLPGRASMLKYYRLRDGHKWLEASEPGYEPILADDVAVIGVLTAVIHWMRS